MLLKWFQVKALLPIIVLILVGCSGGEKKDSTTSPVTAIPGKTMLEQIQYAVLEPHCSSCHSGDPEVPLNFSDLDATKNALFEENGEPKFAINPIANENAWKIVNPGYPAKSFIMRKMEAPGIGEGAPMPNINQILPPTALELIKLWIAEGAKLDAPATDTFPLHEMTATRRREHIELTFQDPQIDCERCHPDHVEQWEISNHAYAAVDPVFKAMTVMGQKATKGKLGQFCVQCHSPIGFVRNELPVLESGTENAYQDFDALTIAGKKGVSCDVCHSITEVIEPLNARMSMTPDGTKIGTIVDPVPTDAHASAYSPLHEEGEVCAPCHNVVNVNGALIEETFDEWNNSRFAVEGPDKKTCQNCHMPESQGRAAIDGPVRTVHDHRMVGVDVSLMAPSEFPGYYELRAATEDLLKSAARLDARFTEDGNFLEVAIENLAGHAIPSGATAERQMWLHIQIRDPEGRLLFESGMLDARGDLMDGNPAHTLNPDGDPQLVKFAQDFLDAPESEIPLDENYFNHVVAMPWQAKGFKNKLINSEETKILTYDLRLNAIPKGSTASVILKFRSFPMYFLRLLEEEGGLDPVIKDRVPIVEMQSLNIEY